MGLISRRLQDYSLLLYVALDQTAEQKLFEMLFQEFLLEDQ